MPQTKEQRAGFRSIRYKGKELKRDKSAKTEVVLLASSVKEYDEMRRDHSDLKVVLDRKGEEQAQMFDTREFLDV